MPLPCLLNVFYNAGKSDAFCMSASVKMAQCLRAYKNTVSDACLIKRKWKIITHVRLYGHKQSACAIITHVCAALAHSLLSHLFFQQHKCAVGNTPSIVCCALLVLLIRRRASLLDCFKFIADCLWSLIHWYAPWGVHTYPLLTSSQPGAWSL